MCVCLSSKLIGAVCWRLRLLMKDRGFRLLSNWQLGSLCPSDAHGGIRARLHAMLAHSLGIMIDWWRTSKRCTCRVMLHVRCSTLQTDPHSVTKLQGVAYQPLRRAPLALHG